MPPRKRIRVLIVEDSRLHAKLLRQAIEAHEDLEVIGVAQDGREALRLTKELEPDLITMDVRLPIMDGHETTQAIMAEHPTPILVVAELSSRYDTAAQQMLGAGALDIFPKPRSLDAWSEASQRLAQRIRILWRVKVVHRFAEERARNAHSSTPGEPLVRPQVIAMVASTGGPHTLMCILSKLPASYPLPIVFVQHIALGFGVGLARWLGQNCALPVYLVDHTLKLVAPGIYMAPDDRHLAVTASDCLEPTEGEPIGSLRPRGDILLSSVACVFGARAVGVVLTGMGDDGARGLLDMRRTGALTIAQDEATSTIYGMPKVAAEMGAAAHILALDEIVERLQALGRLP